MLRLEGIDAFYGDLQALFSVSVDVPDRKVMAGLNPTELGGMIDLVRQLHAGGLTLIVIEHIMAAMMRLAQRIVMLHHGEKIAEGAPREIAADRRVIDAYLGEEFVLADA